MGDAMVRGGGEDMTALVALLNQVLDGRYQVAHLLADEKLASAYVAEDLAGGENVVVRVLISEVAAVAGTERVIEGFDALRDLDHPNIPRVLEAGNADGLPYVITSDVSGPTLRERLGKEGRLAVDEAVDLACVLGHALAYAHGRGHVHGDLTPNRVRFRGDRPVLDAFGILPAVGGPGFRLVESDLDTGTPFYLSPERLRDHHEPGAADEIFALGCLLYEALLGVPPFSGPSASVLFREIAVGTPRSPAALRSGVPDHVDGVVRRALQKRPDARFTSVLDFVDALSDPSFRFETSPFEGEARKGVDDLQVHAARVDGVEPAVPSPSRSADRHLHLEPSGSDSVQDNGHRYAARLLIKGDEDITFIKVEEITWIESERNYVWIHTDVSDYLLRRGIGEMESQLDPARFMRIHRTAIVNLDVVERLVPWFSGGYIVFLKSGKELKLSRGYANKLFEEVGKTL